MTRCRGISNMTDPTPTLAPGPRPVRWRRRILLAGIMPGLLLLAIAIGYFYYQRHRAQQALDAAIAEAARQDPDWRLEQIEAKRSKVAPADNAALPALKAAALIPPRFGGSPLDIAITDLPPTTTLDPKQTEYLRKLLNPLESALPLARQTLPLKQGWITVQWQPDYFSTPTLAQELRRLCNFLEFHAHLCNQDGQHDTAWMDGLTILAVNRAIGQEPSVISQLVRLNLRSLAIACLERTLAQAPGSVSPKLFELAQRDLTEEAAKPLLVHMLRGERAGLHLLLTNLEAGNLDENIQRQYREGDLSDLAFYLRTGYTYKHDHAWLLDYFNKAIAIANLPAPQQLSKLKQLEATSHDGPPVVKKVVAALEKLGRADLRPQAQLQCAIAAIAVERFRLANQAKWPNSLEEVVAAKLLDKVPIDPFDGKPLRYRKTKNGVVVYSIGPDGTYKGDALDALEDVDPTIIRYEFRLWDPDQRRMGPRPAPRPEDHPGDTP
jgi:hypothetical protein